MFYEVLIQTIHDAINFDHPLQQLPTGKKEGKTEIQIYVYLENKKRSVSDEIKHF